MDVLLILDEFDRAWADGAVPDTRAYLRRLCGDDPPSDVALPPEAVDLFAIELEKRWQLDGTAFRLAEDFFREYPALLRNDDQQIAVIVAEYETRHRHGDRPDASTYKPRFPDLWPRLESKLPVVPETDAQTSAGPPPAVEWPLVPGYQCQGLLGQGGMGAVYRLFDNALSRDVAVKVLRTEYRESPGSRQRFLEEARITAQLQHPGIPPIHEIGDLADGSPFLVMKLIKGRTLADLLEARPDPQVDRGHYLGVFEQIGHAVGYAHARGVIHRDLKPANIMVGAFGEVQVMDWGLAKVMGAPSEARDETEPVESTAIHDPRSGSGSSETQAGSLLGTLSYMPPEQAAGAVSEIDQRSDVFGLGAILCVIITGQPPYSGVSVESVRLQAIRGDLAEAFQRLGHSTAEPELVALCQQCLASEKNQRPADAGAVAKAVAELRAAADERARQAELDRVRAESARAKSESEAREQRKRRRVQWVLAGSVLLLVGVGASGAVIASLWRTAVANEQEAMTLKVAADTAKVEAEQQKAIADSAKDDALERKLAAETANRETERQKELADKAKDAAIGQKRNAENAKGEAERQLDIAEKARKGEADALRRLTLAQERLEVVEYGRTLQVAHEEWRDNNIAATRALLDGTNPKLRGWEWKYLDRLCDSSLLTLKGHTGRVYTAAFNSKGTLIVTASLDDTAKVWDAKTGELVHTLKGHTGNVTSASFNVDGTRIVTGSRDKTAKVWDATTGAHLFTFKGHTGEVWSASFDAIGSRIVTASTDGSAKVWDAKSGDELRTLKWNRNKPHPTLDGRASFSPDGTRIVTSGRGSAARVWDAKSGDEVVTLKGQTLSTLCASYSADGTRIVTNGDDRTAKVWDAKTGTELLTLRGHLEYVRSASFSADGTRIVTVGESVKVWDAKSGAEVLTIRGHTALYSASFSPNGTSIVTTSNDGTVKVWGTKTDTEAFTVKVDTRKAFCAAFSPDGARVVTGGGDYVAKVWDTSTGAELLTLRGHTSVVQSATYSTDGTKILTGSYDKTARVWDAKSGAVLLTLKGHTDGVSASFSADGSRIVTASSDGTARVWDAKSGDGLLTLKGPIRMVESASFSPDGTRVVSGWGANMVRVWDAKTGTVLLILKGHKGLVQSASFSPDGTRIVTSSRDTTAKVWDATTGVELLTLKGHTSQLPSASFGADGTRIVTASWDGTVRVWNAKTGAEVLTLKGHGRSVESASFSADGTRIVSAGDSTIKVWDSQTFRETSPLITPSPKAKKK